jgi:hypothetical protein
MIRSGITEYSKRVYRRHGLLTGQLVRHPSIIHVGFFVWPNASRSSLQFDSERLLKFTEARLLGRDAVWLSRCGHLTTVDVLQLFQTKLHHYQLVGLPFRKSGAGNKIRFGEKRKGPEDTIKSSDQA